MATCPVQGSQVPGLFLALLIILEVLLILEDGPCISILNCKLCSQSCHISNRLKHGLYLFAGYRVDETSE